MDLIFSSRLMGMGKEVVVVVAEQGAIRGHLFNAVMN
jgi:hypothetical protein